MGFSQSNETFSVTGFRRFVAVAAMALVVTSASAQTVPYATTLAPATDAQILPEDRGVDGLWQTLNKLRTWASLMTIVAHPDDEDGGMLTYESRGAGVRTALMTLTRGEGGQNAMSGESYDALGLLRTNEILRADEFYATNQYWSRVADYGFSKTIEEAFSRWGHDRVLYDVVRAVRLNRPLVLTSTFVGGITDGHGHHQVSGEMAQEAFLAAGDPTVFPDQIQAGLRPWSPLKVYSRLPFVSASKQGMFDYATGKWAPVRFYNYVDKKWTEGELSSNLEIPEGAFDPLLGRSYIQIARQGWGEQKSQNGGGNPPLAGPNDVRYHRYASRVDTKEEETSFFDGIDVSLVGMAQLAHGDKAFLIDGLKRIEQHVNNAMTSFSPARPSKIAPELRDGYLATQKLAEQVDASSFSADDKANLRHELDIKLVQFNTALAEALGLEVKAIVTPKSSGSLPLAADETIPAATPGANFDVRLHVSSAGGWASGGEVQLAKTWLKSTDEGQPWQISRLSSPGIDDPATTAGDVVFGVIVPRTAMPTRPFFTRPNTEQAFYDVADQRRLNDSFAPYPLEGWAEFKYGAVPIRIGQVVQTVHRVRGPGAVFEPLLVAPGLSLTLPTSAGAVPLSNQDLTLAVKVHSNLDGNTDGELHLQLPEGWTADPAKAAFRLKMGEDTSVSFRVHPASLAEKSYTLQAVATSGNSEYREGYQTVGYPGLRPYNLYRPATYRLRAIDVKTVPGLNVGYVMGTGDDVPQALEQLGVSTHLLNTQEVVSGDLSKYDALVLGIRAYAARPELTAANSRLLDYVHQGGCLIVQYNSGEYDHNFGPYPYVLGRNPEKVVDESAPVTLPEPNHPLLTSPNRITPADFDGWVEERGHSFLQEWDSHYTALTETHDPDQDPQRGGLLFASYGKGVYIYAGLALYRQLPEAVPGAYRILANLVSAGKTAKK
jgi:LmbE family N-acetylglucosaminyl deacetylase